MDGIVDGSMLLVLVITFASLDHDLTLDRVILRVLIETTAGFRAEHLLQPALHL